MSGKNSISFLQSVKYFIVFVVLGWSVYSNTLNGDFHFDDQMTIVENPYIKNISRLDALWVYDPSRFLTHLTFALDYQYHKLNTFGFHLVNIVLHLLNTCLVFVFLAKLIPKVDRSCAESLAGRLAFIAALIFLCHPVQTQAVTYISQRATLLATWSYIGTLLLLFYHRDAGRLRYYFFALGLYFVGIFSKPIIISLPFAILLIEFFVSRVNLKSKLFWAKWVPFFVVSMIIPFLLIFYKFKMFESSYLDDITRETASYTRGEYLFTQFNVMLRYFRLIVFPVGQNLDYDFPVSHTFFQWPTPLSALVLAGVIGLAVYWRNRQPLISFAVAWILLTLALESSFFPISDVINEHRMYIPMVAAGLIIAFVFEVFFKRKKAAYAVLFIVILMFSFLTYQRNKVWQDNIGMLEDIARKSPNKARVFNNMAITYYREGEMDKAEASYKRAIALKKDFTHPMNNLANIYFHRNNMEEARHWLERAIEVDPKYSGAYYNIGNTYLKENNIEKAEEYYIKALNAQPGFVRAIVSLAKIHAKRGNFERAEFYYRSAIDFDRGFTDSYVGLGDLYTNQKKYDRAVEYYQQALALNPEYANVYNSLGNIYDIRGQYDVALEAYQKALHADPQYANAYFNMANTMKKIGKPRAARTMLLKAGQLYQKQKNAVMAAEVETRLKELP